jgi:hypothetical protein
MLFCIFLPPFHFTIYISTFFLFPVSTNFGGLFAPKFLVISSRPPRLKMLDVSCFNRREEERRGEEGKLS